MSKPVGAITYHDGRWHLAFKPHIAMKVKRLFPRIEQKRTGVMLIEDTPEVCRDLEWMMLRWPIEIDGAESAERLRAQADEHRAREEAVEGILTGGLRLSGAGWTDPARPGRDYQLAAADLAWRTGRLLLADDLGLGKTQSGAMLFRDPETLPGLIVCPTHLPRQWEREMAAVMPHLKTHIVSTRKLYDVDADVLILTYSKLAAWGLTLAGQIKSVVFDEVQELRRPDSAKYTGAALIADKAQWKLGLSATPVYNYGGEAHAIFEVLAPGELGSREEFVREWGAAERNGHVIVDAPALGHYLRDQGLLLRRTRKDVHRELPEPIQIVQEIDTDREALEAVEGDVAAMAQLILDRSTDVKERWRISGELDWRLRQATGIAKAPYVAEFARMLLESEQAIVLVGWHRAVYSLWLDALSDFNPVMYTGSESPKQKNESVEAFINGKSRVMILSLRSGAGLDGLQKRSSVVVFGELDWSPEMHNQVIGRLNRDGQEATVAAYFLTSDGGSDPVIARVLEGKRQQAEPIRDPDAELFQAAPDNTDRIRQLAEAVLAKQDKTEGAA